MYDISFPHKNTHQSCPWSRSSGGLPVEPGAVPLVLRVAGHVTGAADSQAWDDGHLLQEHHGGGDSDHLLDKDSSLALQRGTILSLPLAAVDWP